MAGEKNTKDQLKAVAQEILKLLKVFEDLQKIEFTDMSAVSAMKKVQKLVNGAQRSMGRVEELVDKVALSRNFDNAKLVENLDATEKQLKASQEREKTASEKGKKFELESRIYKRQLQRILNTIDIGEEDSE